MPYIESPFKHIPTVPLFINSTIGYHDKTEVASLANHLMTSPQPDFPQ